MTLIDTPRVGARQEKTAGFEHMARSIGLTELHPIDVVARKDQLVKQIQIGIARTQRGEKPTMTDGGILAIPTTSLSLVTPEVWEQVPPGTHGVSAEIAGTNWVIHSGEKIKDGKLVLDSEKPIIYDDTTRKVTFAEFIDRMARPIASAHKKTHDQTPLILDVSLGFPHASVQLPDSSENDVAFIPEDDPKVRGKLTKGWQILDWDELSDEQRLIGKALRDRLAQDDLGVTVERIAFGNDTEKVARDIDAQTEAKQQNLIFFPNGAVFGSGTNIAFNDINTEIGQAPWNQRDDAIYHKMVENGWTTTANCVAEHETGQYLRYRLAAGLQLLGEAGFVTNVDEKVARIVNAAAKEDQAFMTKIATGQIETDPQTQSLAQSVLRRAGQMYGMLAGAVSEVALGQRKADDTPAAILAEGGVIHKARMNDTETVKQMAEITARNLGQPVVFIKASGAKGGLAATMSLPYLKQAA